MDMEIELEYGSEGVWEGGSEGVWEGEGMRERERE